MSAATRVGGNHVIQSSRVCFERHQILFWCLVVDLVSFSTGCSSVGMHSCLKKGIEILSKGIDLYLQMTPWMYSVDKYNMNLDKMDNPQRHHEGFHPSSC